MLLVRSPVFKVFKADYLGSTSHNRRPVDTNTKKKFKAEVERWIQLDFSFADWNKYSWSLRRGRCSPQSLFTLSCSSVCLSFFTLHLLNTAPPFEEMLVNAAVASWVLQNGTANPLLSPRDNCQAQGYASVQFFQFLTSLFEGFWRQKWWLSDTVFIVLIFSWLFRFLCLSTWGRMKVHCNKSSPVLENRKSKNKNHMILNGNH